MKILHLGTVVKTVQPCQRPTGGPRTLTPGLATQPIRTYYLLYLGIAMGIVSIAMDILFLVLVRFHLGCLRGGMLPMPSVIVEVKDRPAAMYIAYLEEFRKQYDGEELTRRFEIFKRSLKEIARMNRESGANFGWTKFSDVASEELMSSTQTEAYHLLSVCGSNVPMTCGNGPHNTTLNYHRGEPIQDTWDWRKEKYVGPVLEQKKCNGCWAFAMVGVMESQAAIRRKVFGPRLSVQEVIDCTKGSGGCDKGNIAGALTYFCTSQWGVVTEEDYPLKLVTQKCQSTSYERRGLQLRQFWQLCNVDEADIMRLVYHHGPVIVVVNADPWLSYIDGVIQRGCVHSKDVNHVNHVVQIVGYNNSSDTKVPYFIVRNSWGEDFGEDGYVRLAIGGNVCGLKDNVSILDVYA